MLQSWWPQVLLDSSLHLPSKNEKFLTATQFSTLGKLLLVRVRRSKFRSTRDTRLVSSSIRDSSDTGSDCFVVNLHHKRSRVRSAPTRTSYTPARRPNLPKSMILLIG